MQDAQGRGSRSAAGISGARRRPTGAGGVTPGEGKPEVINDGDSWANYKSTVDTQASTTPDPPNPSNRGTHLKSKGLTYGPFDLLFDAVHHNSGQFTHSVSNVYTLTSMAD